MNLDHDFFQVRKLSEDKKSLHQNWKIFFPQIQVIQMQTRVKFLGGDADVDHSQILGGDAIKLLGWIYPPHPPPGFRHPLLPVLVRDGFPRARDSYAAIASAVANLYLGTYFFDTWGGTPNYSRVFSR